MDLTVLNQKLDIINTQAVGSFAQMAKQLEALIDAQYAALNQQMKERSISSIKGDWGSISMAERINWKTTAELDDYYLKSAPDTKKLKAAFDAGETVPGADFTTTVYMTKRIK